MALQNQWKVNIYKGVICIVPKSADKAGASSSSIPTVAHGRNTKDQEDMDGGEVRRNSGLSPVSMGVSAHSTVGAHSADANTNRSGNFCNELERCENTSTKILNNSIRSMSGARVEPSSIPILEKASLDDANDQYGDELEVYDNELAVSRASSTPVLTEESVGNTGCQSRVTEILSLERSCDELSTCKDVLAEIVDKVLAMVEDEFYSGTAEETTGAMPKSVGSFCSNLGISEDILTKIANGREIQWKRLDSVYLVNAVIFEIWNWLRKHGYLNRHVVCKIIMILFDVSICDLDMKMIERRMQLVMEKIMKLRVRRTAKGKEELHTFERTLFNIQRPRSRKQQLTPKIELFEFDNVTDKVTDSDMLHKAVQTSDHDRISLQATNGLVTKIDNLHSEKLKILKELEEVKEKYQSVSTSAGVLKKEVRSWKKSSSLFMRDIESGRLLKECAGKVRNQQQSNIANRNNPNPNAENGLNSNQSIEDGLNPSREDGLNPNSSTENHLNLTPSAENGLNANTSTENGHNLTASPIVPIAENKSNPDKVNTPLDLVREFQSAFEEKEQELQNYKQEIVEQKKLYKSAANTTNRKLKRWETNLRKKKAALSNYRCMIGSQDQKLENLHAIVEEKVSQLDKCNALINGKQRELSQSKSMIARKTRQLERCKLMARRKDRELAKCNEKLQSKFKVGAAGEVVMSKYEGEKAELRKELSAVKAKNEKYKKMIKKLHDEKTKLKQNSRYMKVSEIRNMEKDV